MPDTRVHLDQARHNEAFFSEMSLDLYGDWAVTVLFYSALHYIDAYLAKMGHIDPGSHDVRDGLVSRFPETRAVARQYFRLKNFSSSARYYGAHFTRSEANSLRLGEFDAVKARMMAQLP